MSDDLYTESYFLRGEELGLSCYTRYSWLPEPTHRMARAIADSIHLTPDMRIVDFGAARGFLVRALREQGYDTWGVDVSTWAVAHADETVAKYVRHEWPDDGVPVDWIVAKDVLEHLDAPALVSTVQDLWARAQRGLFVVVPVSRAVDGPYIVPAYERDVTHRIRWPAWRWLSLFLALPGPKSGGLTNRVEGVKDNWAAFVDGNAFFIIRRVGVGLGRKESLARHGPAGRGRDRLDVVERSGTWQSSVRQDRFGQDKADHVCPPTAGGGEWVRGLRVKRVVRRRGAWCTSAKFGGYDVAERD